MGIEVIDSYLVALGAHIDEPSFDKFEKVLKQSGTTVSQSVGGMIGDLLKFQVAGTTAFLTVGFGIIGYIDKLAMLDQKQKLQAMQNMMNVQQYRAVSMALDTLGVSLDDVFFGTKELQDHFHTLIDDQKKLAGMLGPGYEKQMEQVRAVRFELQRLEVKGEYFGMKFVSDLLTKLGFGEGGILEKLERLNDFVLEKMPEWSDELSTDVVPILHEFWGILVDIKDILGETANVFTNTMGVMSGDDSLQGPTTNFHQFATAVGDAVYFLHMLLQIMLDVEKVGANVLLGTLGAAGDFLAAGGGVAGVAAVIGDPNVRRRFNAAADSSVDLAHVLTGTNQDYGFGPIGGGGPIMRLPNGNLVTRRRHLPGETSEAGLPKGLIDAIISVESAGHQNGKDGGTLTSNKGALGLMQLEPATARELGVDPSDPVQNRAGGTKYMQQLLKHYGGDVDTALVAYNWGMGHVDRALKAHRAFDPGAVAYARNVESRAGIQIGTLQVSVPPSAHSPQQIAEAVKTGVRDGLQEHYTRLMPESSGAFQ